MENKRLKVAITLGDVNGIGTEVVIKALLDRRMMEICTPIIYGSNKAIALYKKTIEQGEEFQCHVVSSAKNAKIGEVNLVECMGKDIEITTGKPSKKAGEYAAAALKAAVEEAKSGVVDVVVTAPINKVSIQSESFNFLGHTEFFASEFKGEPLMVMCNEMMRVGLVTIHMPLADVPTQVTKERVKKSVMSLQKSLIEDFGIVKPRIAILSLNPHAGERGLLGKEEIEIIEPAIREINEQGVLVFGTFPSDGFFGSGEYRKYDATLAMYHDQGLTPFKALSDAGVNFTAGLPIVRTSPDHGVAYDIAGQGVADESSTREAIYMAIDIFRNRALHTEMNKNPLPYSVRESGNVRELSVKDMLPEEGDN